MTLTELPRHASGTRASSRRTNLPRPGVVHHCKRMPLHAPTLHLASRSPRRRRLLTEYGIPHEAVVPDVDDADLAPGDVSPAEWVAALAYFKAAATRPMLAVREGGDPTGLALGADTVVLKEGRIIGQPRDAEEALEIIRLLENGQHEVLTGVALVDLSSGRRDLFVDRARVRVGSIGGERIGEYIARGGWRGKAGGYNLMERIQDGWPIEYEGDPTTVMGLPMRILPARLEAFARGSALAPAVEPA